MQRDVGIADQQKPQKQGREDSIKKVQYTTPPYISLMWKDMEGWVVY